MFRGARGTGGKFHNVQTANGERAFARQKRYHMSNETIVGDFKIIIGEPPKDFQVFVEHLKYGHVYPFYWHDGPPYISLAPRGALANVAADRGWDSFAERAERVARAELRRRGLIPT
jgi:hypothetical protein